MTRPAGLLPAIVALLVNVGAGVTACFAGEPGLVFLLMILVVCTVQSSLLPFLFSGRHYRWLQLPSLLTGLLTGAYFLDWHLSWIGGASLMTAVALCVLVLYLLNHLLVEPENGFERDAKKRPVVVLLPFLTLFLHITLLLTFALAFIDKSHHGPILAASSPEIFLELGEVGGATETAAPASSITRVVTFPLGSADPGASWEQIADLPEDEFLRRYSSNPQACAARSNWHSLKDITDFINSVGEMKRVRVLLVGHANEAQPGEEQQGSERRKYRSNFELSAARAVQVQLLVLKRLGRGGQRLEDRPAIEWVHIPVASEDSFLDKSSVDAATADGALDPKLVTEVLATAADDSYDSKIRLVADLMKQERPQVSFALLDYLYFMVYTITTTGYGDIVPTKPVARFITIVANLIEVLYLVVFLNVLLAVLNRRGRLSAASDESGS